jgi:hypothetical protein
VYYDILNRPRHPVSPHSPLPAPHARTRRVCTGTLVHYEQTVSRHRRSNSPRSPPPSPPAAPHSPPPALAAPRPSLSATPPRALADNARNIRRGGGTRIKKQRLANVLKDKLSTYCQALPRPKPRGRPRLSGPYTSQLQQLKLSWETLRPARPRPGQGG